MSLSFSFGGGSFWQNLQVKGQILQSGCLLLKLPKEKATALPVVLQSSIAFGNWSDAIGDWDFGSQIIFSFFEFSYPVRGSTISTCQKYLWQPLLSFRTYTYPVEQQNTWSCSKKVANMTIVIAWIPSNFRIQTVHLTALFFFKHFFLGKSCWINPPLEQNLEVGSNFQLQSWWSITPGCLKLLFVRISLKTTRHTWIVLRCVLSFMKNLEVVWFGMFFFVILSKGRSDTNVLTVLQSVTIL